MIKILLFMIFFKERQKYKLKFRYKIYNRNTYQLKEKHFTHLKVNDQQIILIFVNN